VYDFINDLIEKQGSRVVPKSKYRTTKSSFRQSLVELANAQNENIPAERRVSQHTILSVAERSLSSTPNLENDTRRFIAYKEAASFVSFAATGDITNSSLEKYYDLLPVGHPASTRKHAMTASAFRHTRARWIAADPRLDEEVREIVAAAYMYEGNTVEHAHAITRLTALTAASVPRDIFLSALTAAFSFGDGNSSAARSMRANLQWRDRMGRWIEMGRGIGFKINIGGNNVPVNGKFIGVDGKRGLVQVKGDANLPDGIYPVESSNAQEYKALLPDSVAGKLKGKLSSIFDKRAQIFSKEEMIKMRMDAPAGWKKNEDGSFGSDDDYIVDESNGKLTLFRKDKNGDKGAQVGESVDDWAQIQDLANADEADYDKFKRIMSAPENADVLPGSETDPYDKMPESTKAFLKGQEDKKAADKAFFDEKRKKYNEEVDKFEAMFEQGKDIEGRDIPEGWELAISKYSVDGAPEIRSFQKLVPSADGKKQVQIIAEVRDDGKIQFGHRADWFEKPNSTFPDQWYDTWEEAEAQIPRVVKWVGDSESLLHDPANPWWKETIPVPRDGDGGGGVEPTSPEPTSPEAPVAEAPATDEVSQEVISKLEAPAGAWKLQSPDKFEPEGRVDDEMSPDFSDDPEVLANKFGTDALVDGFIQAVIGKKDYALDLLEEDDVEYDDNGDPIEKKKGPGAPKKKAEKGIQGFGVGALDFKNGEEWVPAEALYLALKKQGYDADLLLAQLYDSGLGESKNQDLLKSLRKEENVQAQTPLVDAIDLEDAEVMARVNAEVAAPGPAGAVMAQLEEINKNGEPNQNIVDLAARVRKESKEPSGSALSEDMPEAFVQMLEDYIGWANSDNLDEKQAFQALWGAIMALDGGLSDGKEETSVQRAVADALEKYNGTPPSYEEVQQFFADNGKFTDLMRSKKALVDGNESLDDSQSFAGAYYRLIAEAGRYNEFSLHRGIQVPADSEFIQNLKKGNALAFDARPFSKDRNTAAMFAGVLSKGSIDKAAVVFKIAPLKGKSVDMASISPFPDEQEQVVWGNFKIVSVKKSKNSYDKPVYEVEVERITKRDAVLDGYDDSYEPLLMSENNSPEMPEGYHQIDTAPYQPIGGEGYPGGFEDRPDVVAKNYERDSLVEVFRGAIEDGTGEATLEWDGEEVSVPVELIRDALQVQGIDTNSILDDIANADPNAGVSDEADTEPAEQNLDNPVDEIVADVSTEYDMAGWKKVGPQLGSNEGGFYEDAEGNRFYVKKPKSELHAENEVLAAALYKLLGIDAADIGIASGDDGVKMTFSPDIIGSKQDLQSKLNDPEYLAKLQEGFAVDAWLGNWDVAGLAFDNVMSNGSGNPVRVDPGGALLFRAMGKPKGTLFGNEVNELDSLRDENMNPQSAAVFGSMTDEQQKESARKLLDISNDDIGSMVDGIITDEKAAEELKTKLKARRQFILDRYDLLSEDTSVIVDNADISEEQDADPEAVMSPEGVKGEIDQAMDTAAGWAQEYADDEDLLPSQRKNFQKVSDQIDSAMVDWRNGEISDEELSGVLQELIDFNESWPWDTKDPNIMNKVDDISEQLQALKNVVDDYNKANAPEGATPEPEAPVSAPEPVMTESVNNPVVDANGSPINPGAKVRYEKKGVVLEGTFSRYDKSPQYVWVNFGDGKKPKAISTKYLTVIEGGGGGGPKAPEAPESPEPEAPTAPTPETPQEDIGQYEPTAQLTNDGKVRVSFIVDGNRPFNPKGDGPAGYEEVLPYVVDSKLDVDGVDEVTVEIPLDKMDDFAKTYKSVFDEKLVPEEFYGDIYTDYQEPKPEDSAKSTPEPEVKTDKELPEFSPEGWERSVTPDDEILGIKVDNSNRIIFDKKQKNGSSLRIAVDKSTLEDPKLREGLEDLFTAMDDLHQRYPIDGLVIGINNPDPDNPEVMGTTASFEDEPGQPPVITINKELLTKKQRISVEHTAAHEYGHALDPRTKEEAEKGLEEFKALMSPTYNKFPMTEYGLTSGREAFAEAFAAFYVRKYGKPFDPNAPKTSYTQSQKVFQNDKFWENTIKHFNIEELATEFERSPFKVEDTFDADNPATLQENYTPETPEPEAPAAVKPSASTPFPTEPILNDAADELVKLFSYGMPDGGKILAVHEKDGMIAATPDGETVYIIDAKKKTNYTPEAKPDFFEPGGNGIEVFKWRQPTKEENDALLEKIAQNKSEPYGTQSEPVEDVDAAEELEVPEGFTAIDDSKGKKIFAGVKVADKDGVIGTVKKVNKDNYALVDFGDGVVKWRSGKTLNSTGEADENFQGSTPKASTSKATGAGAAPVVVDSPADWKVSNFESVPALPDAIAKALDMSSPKAAMQGASAAVDADSIEDLDVRVMHVRDENGVDNIQLKFKLTNWAGKKKVAEIAKMTESERVEAGIQVEPLKIPRINVGPDGVGQVSANEYAFTNSTGRTYTITTDDGIVIRIHRANADSSDQFTKKTYGETPARAFHNTVQIQAPVDATDDQIANALALAGVSEVRPATPADAQILIENRLMSIFDAKTDANTNPKGEKRTESLENVKNKWGLTVADVIVTTGASGRVEYRLSEEGAKKIWEATGKPEALTHGLRNPGVLSYNMSDEEKVKAMTDWVVNFVNNPQGGLLSTTTRWTEGVGGNGQSSTTDVGTGGADYVFTRPTKSADRKKYGTSDWLPTLYFDPLKAYERLDFYANYTDAFGKRSKNKDVISAAKVGAYEVMFKQRLAWDDLDVMVVSKDIHQGVIEGLKAKGIDTIGGRPIEEVIIVGGTK
jgi:hypothetical protein